METTIFRQLTNLITVEDICSPIETYDGNRSVDEVLEEWAIDLPLEKGIDSMEQIALIRLEGKLIGWFGFDMLHGGKKLYEIADPTIADKVISANTPLLEAIKIFSENQQSFYFILKSNQLLGWLNYTDFYKLPFRLCLYALLINLEKMMLDIAESSPLIAIKFLPSGRLEKAKKLYDDRGYSKDKNGKETTAKLLECTTFIDKISIMRKWKSVRLAIPALDDELYKIAEKLRNELAHPRMEEQSLLLLPKEKILPFINWADEFCQQMNIYLEGNENRW